MIAGSAYHQIEVSVAFWLSADLLKRAPQCLLSEDAPTSFEQASEANAKCVQLNYAIDVDRCRYRTLAQSKKQYCGFIRDRLRRSGRRCFGVITWFVA